MQEQSTIINRQPQQLMSGEVLVRREDLVSFKDGRTICRSFWLVKKSELKLLAVGTHREERDEEGRED